MRHTLTGMPVNTPRPSIYPKPCDGFPPYIIVQVSARKYVVAEFQHGRSDAMIFGEYVTVSGKLGYSAAYSLCQKLRLDREQSSYRCEV